MKERDVKKWMLKTLDGKITKEKLDRQRQLEVNANDMMQNTSILYHPESVAEMQAIILGIVWSRLYNSIPDHFAGDADMNEDLIQLQATLQTIFIGLMIEHVASYFIELFRRYDIEKNGVLDINGVPRAKAESLLATIQYFFICFMIGFILQKLINIERDKCPIWISLCLQWTIIDMSLMLLTRMYISLALFLKQEGEIVKNIYSLFDVQKNYRDS